MELVDVLRVAGDEAMAPVPLRVADRLHLGVGGQGKEEGQGEVGIVPLHDGVPRARAPGHRRRGRWRVGSVVGLAEGRRIRRVGRARVERRGQGGAVAALAPRRARGGDGGGRASERAGERRTRLARGGIPRGRLAVSAGDEREGACERAGGAPEGGVACLCRRLSSSGAWVPLRRSLDRRYGSRGRDQSLTVLGASVTDLCFSEESCERLFWAWSAALSASSICQEERRRCSSPVMPNGAPSGTYQPPPGQPYGVPPGVPPPATPPPGYGGQPPPPGAPPRPARGRWRSPVLRLSPARTTRLCGLAHCNTQYGKCAFPRINADVDCIQGAACLAGFCIPKLPGQ